VIFERKPRQSRRRGAEPALAMSEVTLPDRGAPSLRGAFAGGADDGVIGLYTGKATPSRGRLIMFKEATFAWAREPAQIPALA
jgi:hypothetical protein